MLRDQYVGRTGIIAILAQHSRAAVGDAMNQSPQGKVMTLPEVAQYLRCHPSRIYRLLKRGELPGFKIGSEWRFNSEMIERFSRKKDGGPTKGKP